MDAETILIEYLKSKKGSIIQGRNLFMDAKQFGKSKYKIEYSGEKYYRIFIILTSPGNEKLTKANLTIKPIGISRREKYYQIGEV